jgi:WD repeat-containing protein 35
MVNSIAFEGSGLRISLGVGSSLYFGNLKMDYKWGYINQSQTLVFAY